MAFTPNTFLPCPPVSVKAGKAHLFSQPRQQVAVIMLQQRNVRRKPVGARLVLRAFNNQHVWVLAKQNGSQTINHIGLYKLNSTVSEGFLEKHLLDKREESTGGKLILLLPYFFLCGVLLPGDDTWSCSSHSVNMRGCINSHTEDVREEIRMTRSLMMLTIKQLFIK